MTTTATDLTSFFAVSCDLYLGGYRTILVEASDRLAARVRARELGHSPTLGLKASRVSRYGVRFHGGHVAHPLQGEPVRLPHYTTASDGAEMLTALGL